MGTFIFQFNDVMHHQQQKDDYGQLLPHLTAWTCSISMDRLSPAYLSNLGMILQIMAAILSGFWTPINSS